MLWDMNWRFADVKNEFECDTCRDTGAVYIEPKVIIGHKVKAPGMLDACPECAQRAHAIWVQAIDEPR